MQSLTREPRYNPALPLSIYWTAKQHHGVIPLLISSRFELPADTAWQSLKTRIREQIKRYVSESGMTDRPFDLLDCNLRQGQINLPLMPASKYPSASLTALQRDNDPRLYLIRRWRECYSLEVLRGCLMDYYTPKSFGQLAQLVTPELMSERIDYQAMTLTDVQSYMQDSSLKVVAHCDKGEPAPRTTLGDWLGCL